MHAPVGAVCDVSLFMFGLQILQEIADNGINIYQFPDSQMDEEDDVANRVLRVGHTV